MVYLLGFPAVTFLGKAKFSWVLLVAMLFGPPKLTQGLTSWKVIGWKALMSQLSKSSAGPQCLIHVNTSIVFAFGEYLFLFFSLTKRPLQEKYLFLFGFQMVASSPGEFRETWRRFKTLGILRQANDTRSKEVSGMFHITFEQKLQDQQT